MTPRDDSPRSPLRDAILAVTAILVAVALCIGLGVWQWHRFESKREVAATIRANYDAPPAQLRDLLPAPDSQLTAAQDWTPVELAGHYCTEPGCVLYVRNRPLGAAVGFWQLVPFETADGTVLIVRGWVDSDEVESAPAEEPEIPEGEITVVAHLRPEEPVLGDRTNPAGQVQSVNPAQFADQLPVDGPVHTGAYGDLVSESPTDIARPRPLEKPETSLGPHLSYAFQWWIFALFFPAALVVRARRARRDRLEAEAAERAATATVAADGEDPADGPPHGPRDPGAPGAPPAGSRIRRSRGGRPAPARRSRARTRDEEEEDALLDEHDR
ncbi:SURF1 family protein [Brachybacterium phenoliresistens]|uniref:SURF1 family cytochrome oxidase biogenesis protein n=1 Tax=Brachybacterium phenoliresistens TaxID=396014 RepID=UPI0031E2CEC6